MSILSGDNIVELSGKPKGSVTRVNIENDLLRERREKEEAKRKLQRLEDDLKRVEGERDEHKSRCEKECAAKEEASKALLVERERHQKMMDECMKANENAAKADARAASLVTSLEAAEVQVSVEQRARLEAEKRCTEMMDHIKTLLSIQAKPEKKEMPKHEKSGFRVHVLRDGNQDMRELRIVEE